MPRDENLLSPEEFLKCPASLPVIDVRSPAEYEKGHIPGAVNICLFTNEERALIGTLYHQQSRDAAFSKGLSLISPKLEPLVKKVRDHCPERKTRMYCLRGGMRSESFAGLLRAAGFSVSLLDGGYKAYRRFLFSELEKPAKILVLGGYTGAGKTAILNHLGSGGFQIIDLEKLACHKGSVFGAIGQPEQPTSEHFENLIFEQWRKMDLSAPLLLEDENMDIGRVKLPLSLYRKIRSAPLLLVETDREQRLSNLVAEYANHPAVLISAIRKIEKRLGNQRMNLAIEAVQRGSLREAAGILLAYYDESYEASIRKREEKSLHRTGRLTGRLQEAVAKVISLIPMALE